ncbi:NlpC/P60 family protein [Nonomuraea sp. NPDC050680]|uniref:C40 family peptidase n=1 Tax=Nonomuraea sp. NPDC050680 TaxID=3154630 RepID=UPI0033DEE118
MHALRAGLMAVCLVVTLCPPADAAPGPSRRKVMQARHAVRDRTRQLGTASARLAEAQSRLDDLAAGAERQVEAYNGELVHLERARRARDQAQARLALADAEVEKARAPVALLAAQGYSGLEMITPMLGMMTDTGDTDGYLHRASVLEQLSGEQGAMLDRMRDAQDVAAILRGAAADAYAEHEAVSERARQAKIVAEAAVAAQKRETRGLEAERVAWQRRVDAARTQAHLLARRREAALAQARLSHGLLASGSLMGDVAANWALTQLGKPYVWAADGPDSFDCSGLTMRAWEQAGVGIDHWTGTQWTSGPHVPLDQLRRGDLLFFGYVTSDPSTIHHVGMYVGNGLMVHAPQTGDVVRVASMWRGDLVGATRPQ